MFDFKQINFQHSVWFSNWRRFMIGSFHRPIKSAQKYINLKTFPSKQDCVLFDENDGMTDTYNEL